MAKIFRLTVMGWFLPIVSISGCTVGPTYVPPRVEMPSHFVEQSRRLSPATGDMGGGWWHRFNDPVLDQLVADAQHTAPDLRIAEARLREARATLTVAGVRQWPQVEAGSAYQRQHGSENVPVGTPPGGLGPDVGSNLWLAGFDAEWEIDIFGGTRRAIEAATADVGAATADRQNIELTLMAEIARDYVLLRAEQRRLAIERHILSLREDTARLVSVRVDSGLAGALDAARAQAELSDSEADAANLEARVHVAIYRLSVLVGKTPEDLKDHLLEMRDIPLPAGDVPIGLPSDLLRRRPDIQAAERRVAAATARIGTHEADLYPHFFLTAGTGLESLNADRFFSYGSRYFSIGPSIDWRVFDAGRVRAEILAASAKTDEETAAYRKVILGALSDVESALITYGRSKIQQTARQREVAATQQAVELASRLYKNGLEDFLTVIDAERTLRAAETDLATADQDNAIAFIALLKALGGDWQGPMAAVAANNGRSQ